MLIGQLTIAQSAFKMLEPVKWQTSIKKKSDCVYELHFTAKIDKDFHLYSQEVTGGPNPTLFSFEKGNFKLLGKAKEFTPHIIKDPGFEIDVKVFENSAEFIQEVELQADGVLKIKGNIDYQSCNSETCIPGLYDFEFDITGSPSCKLGTTPALNIHTTSLPTVPSTITINGPTISVKEDSMFIVDTQKVVTASTYSFKDKACGAPKYSETKAEDSNWLLFLLAFGAGLIALLTPCVFPMIPMTVSFFLNDAESKKHGRAKAIFFGISIILIFCLIGTLFSLAFGSDSANLLATHWIPNMIFFVIFIVFAASFFGLFEITLPRKWINAADKNADKGGYFGVFFMALTTVLVSFSCTGPIAGSLLVQASEGELTTPLIGMLGFSTALAIPFTLFAFFPSMMRALPKSGGWLNSVKIVFGFLELALALKFLSTADLTEHWGILDRDIFIALWVVIFALLGFYLLGWIKFAHDAEVKSISIFRLGLIISVFGFVFYLLPGLIGAPLKFMSGFLPPMSTHDFNLLQKDQENSGKNTAKYSDILHAPLGINAYFDYEEGMAAAAQLGKPVLLDFTGLGCTNCRKIEDNIWTDPKVLQILKEDYVVISLYVDERTIQLPINEQYVSKVDGRQIKTLGQKNADIEKCFFNFNAQPFYVLMNNQEALLNSPIDYKKANNVDRFVNFLEEGKKKYSLK